MVKQVMHRASKTFKTREQAADVVHPTLNEVALLHKEWGLPNYQWSMDNLQRWLERLEMGSKVFGRTGMFGNLPVGVVVDRWDKKMHSIALPPNIQDISGGPEFFWEFESEYLEKAGPIGGFLPWSSDTAEKVKELVTPTRISKTCNREALEKAIDVIRHLGDHSPIIVPTSIDVALKGSGKSGGEDALDGTTNGCDPVVIHRWVPSPDLHTQVEEREMAFNFICRAANDLRSKLLTVDNPRRYPLPQVGIMHQRVNEPKGKDPLKEEKYKRLVVAMPKWSDTVLGNTIAPQCESTIMSAYWPKTGLPLMIGHLDGAHVDKAVELLMQYAESIGEIVLSIDYSHFDRSISPELRDMVDDAISGWMNRGAANIYLYIENSNIRNTYLIQPNGLVEPTPHGVNSGSKFTNFIDSMVNLTCMLYGHFAGYYELHSAHPQGDDCIAVGRGLNPETVQKAGEDLGLVLNPEKQLYKRHMATYLKRYYFQGRYGGIYPANRAVTKAVSAEDDVGALSNNASVSWQITYKAVARAGNVVYHPDFAELIQYLMNGDSIHHLGRDVSPETVTKLAGDYALRYQQEMKMKPYLRQGQGVGWNNSLVNGVIRGEKVPTENDALFERVTGVRFGDVTYDNLRHPIAI